MIPKALREQISKNEFLKSTAGQCPSYVQANMLVLPSKYANSFEEFAKQNAKALPVLEIVKDSHYTSFLAKGADLLDEIPFYDILENGAKTKTVKDIKKYYTNDLVFFMLGCSFSFESALLQNNISLRHVKEGKNVAMYKTNIKLNPVDMFKGEMVVSMRPIKKELVAKACVVTSHFPQMHGSPIQVGYPEMIGIKDIKNPDYGDKIEIKADEIPVFWPCGVTPQNVLEEIKLPFAISHSPGFMFVSDKKDSDFYKN